MNLLLILFPNQLFPHEYLKKILDYTEDNLKIKSIHIILWEHPYFFTLYPYHKTKLVFHRATMKNYFDDLEKFKLLRTKGSTKLYVEFTQPESVLIKYIELKQIDQVRFFNPIEKELINLIKTNKILNQIEKLIFTTPYFLNSTNHETNNEIYAKLKVSRHDLFYKSQRISWNIMVKKSGSKYVPDGGAWSFDKSNRNKFDDSIQSEPKLIYFKDKKTTKYLTDANIWVQKHFPNNYGMVDLENWIYPINRTQSIKWLDFFIQTKLDNFGKYEDALSSKIKFGYHSLLSAVTGIGLVLAKEIVEKVSLYNKNIASKEGFLRQIIGWREYCYYTYDLFSQTLKTKLFYKSSKSIPRKFWEITTQIPPIDNILKSLNQNAYSHHIERLMGVGNFLILIGVSIHEISDWFRVMYIDAYDVFMIPNVYGMLGYGFLENSTHMMTRPYFASSNYIIKMSDYKSEECVHIDDKIYKWDEIMDGLYWNHIQTYSKEFEKIYSTASAVAMWNKFNIDKKKRLENLAKLYIKWIYS